MGGPWAQGLPGRPPGCPSRGGPYAADPHGDPSCLLTPPGTPLGLEPAAPDWLEGSSACGRALPEGRRTGPGGPRGASREGEPTSLPCAPAAPSGSLPCGVGQHVWLGCQSCPRAPVTLEPRMGPSWAWGWGEHPGTQGGGSGEGARGGMDSSRCAFCPGAGARPAGWEDGGGGALGAGQAEGTEGQPWRVLGVQPSWVGGPRAGSLGWVRLRQDTAQVGSTAGPVGRTGYPGGEQQGPSSEGPGPGHPSTAEGCEAGEGGG